MNDRTASLRDRVGFVIALARRLHEYGTAAPRLEEAIGKVSARLGLVCDVLSTPTSIVLSFTEQGHELDPVADITQVIRLAPGEVNLRRLCAVDEIADRVIDGSLDLQTGYRQLLELGRPPSRRTRWLTVLSFGVASASVATLLKLTFGAVAATQLCRVVGVVPPSGVLPPVPLWVEWLGLGAGALSFAVLFRSAPRDGFIVVGSVMFGYALTRLGGAQFGPEFGVFIAGLGVGAASNLYATWYQRPGAVIREPGIILLVPGSVGFKSLSFVFERDVFLGVDTAFSLITILVSLVAGLLFGDLLVPPRRSL